MPDRYRSEWPVHLGGQKGWMDGERMGGCDRGRDGWWWAGGENSMERQAGENEK